MIFGSSFMKEAREAVPNLSQEATEFISAYCRGVSLHCTVTTLS